MLQKNYTVWVDCVGEYSYIQSACWGTEELFISSRYIDSVCTGVCQNVCMGDPWHDEVVYVIFCKKQVKFFLFMVPSLNSASYCGAVLWLLAISGQSMEYVWIPLCLPSFERAPQYGLGLQRRGVGVTAGGTCFLAAASFRHVKEECTAWPGPRERSSSLFPCIWWVVNWFYFKTLKIVKNI